MVDQEARYENVFQKAAGQEPRRGRSGAKAGPAAQYSIAMMAWFADQPHCRASDQTVTKQIISVWYAGYLAGSKAM
jgi:hypothetical protein